jgi:putative ABC transport system substrate-binding protein
MRKNLLPAIFVMFLLSMAPAFAGGASEPAKAPEDVVIGVSKIVAHPALDAVEQGIQDALAEMGYNFNYDLQNANGDPTAAASIANKFKVDKVDFAVGIATPTSQALVQALEGTDTVIIYSAITNPVDAGLVESFDKGEENITGVSDLTPVKAQIELLSKLTDLKRLGHVYSSGEANAVFLAEEAKKACEEMGIEFVETTVTNSAEVKSAVQTIIGRVDGIYVSTDNTVVSALAAVTEVAMKNKVPIMSADPSSAEQFDVLAAWGFNYYKMGRATGRMIADIYKGKKPKDIPTLFMTDPADSDLLLNLDVAEALGIRIPSNVQNDATLIVENGKLTKK